MAGEIDDHQKSVDVSDCSNSDACGLNIQHGEQMKDINEDVQNLAALFKSPMSGCGQRKRKSLLHTCNTTLNDTREINEAAPECPLSSTPLQAVRIDQSDRHVASEVEPRMDIMASLVSLVDNIDDSWTSSMATPHRNTVLSPTLDTEERKVLLPSKENSRATKQRVLFSEDDTDPGESWDTLMNLSPRDCKEKSAEDTEDAWYWADTQKLVYRTPTTSQRGRSRKVEIYGCSSSMRGKRRLNVLEDSGDSEEEASQHGSKKIFSSEKLENDSDEECRSPSLISGVSAVPRNELLRKSCTPVEEKRVLTQYDLSFSVLEEFCQDMSGSLNCTPTKNTYLLENTNHTSLKESNMQEASLQLSEDSEVLVNKRSNNLCSFQETEKNPQAYLQSNKDLLLKNSSALQKLPQLKYKNQGQTNSLLYSLFDHLPPPIQMVQSNAAAIIMKSVLCLEADERFREASKPISKTDILSSEGFIPFSQLEKKNLLSSSEFATTKNVDDKRNRKDESFQVGACSESKPANNMNRDTKRSRSEQNVSKEHTEKQSKLEHSSARGENQCRTELHIPIQDKASLLETGETNRIHCDHSSKGFLDVQSVSDTQIAKVADAVEILMMVIDENHLSGESKKSLPKTIKSKSSSSDQVDKIENNLLLGDLHLTSSILILNQPVSQDPFESPPPKQLASNLATDDKEEKGENTACLEVDKVTISDSNVDGKSQSEPPNCVEMNGMEKAVLCSCAAVKNTSSTNEIYIDCDCNNMNTEASTNKISVESKDRRSTKAVSDNDSSNTCENVKEFPAHDYNMSINEQLLADNHKLFEETSTSSQQNLYSDRSFKGREKISELNKKAEILLNPSLITDTKNLKDCDDNGEIISVQNSKTSLKTLNDEYARLKIKKEVSTYRNTLQGDFLLEGCNSNTLRETHTAWKELNSTKVNQEDQDRNQDSFLFSQDTEEATEKSNIQVQVPDKISERQMAKINVLQTSQELTRDQKAIECVDIFQVPEELFDEHPSQKRSVDFRDFSTDSGKKIAVSDDALWEAHKRLEEESKDSTPLRPLDFKGFATASGKKIAVSDDALREAHKLLEEESKDSTPLRPLDFKGFATASGKKIAVSDDALREAHKLLEEESKDSTPLRPLDFKGFATASGKKIAVPDDALREAYKRLEEESKDSTPLRPLAFKGFATASGKKIAVSDDALWEAQKRLEGESKDSTPLRPLAFKGFATASGKKIADSDDALREAHKRLEEESKDSTPLRPLDFKGFATASGKKIAVSDDALREAHKLLEEESKDSTPLRPLDFKGFATASGKKIAVSDDALREAHKRLEEKSKDSTPLRPLDFKGFATASGKNVAVSDDALREAYKRLEEESKDSTPVRPLDFKGFATASGKKIAVSDDALWEAHKRLEEESKDSTPLRPLAFKGFATASGKKIAVSDDALREAHKRLEEESKDSTPLRPLAFKGFATASGKKIAVSDDALREAHKRLEGESKDSTPLRPLDFKGFATASGKNVAVSDDALREAHKRLEGESKDSTPSRRLDFKGFATASGKKIAVSDDALREAHKRLKEESKDSTPVRPLDFKGFATASGKKIAVSDDALREAHKWLEEESKDSTSVRPLDFKGFATASGKNVAVSDDALREAQKRLEEVSKDSTPVNRSTVDLKAVTVREDSLPRVDSGSETMSINRMGASSKSQIFSNEQGSTFPMRAPWLSMDSSECGNVLVPEVLSQNESVLKQCGYLRPHFFNKNIVKESQSEEMSKCTIHASAEKEEEEAGCSLSGIKSQKYVLQADPSDATLRETKFLLDDEVCNDFMNTNFALQEAKSTLGCSQKLFFRAGEALYPNLSRPGHRAPAVAGSLTQEVWECKMALLADEGQPPPAWAHSLLSCPDMVHDRETGAPQPLLSGSGSQGMAEAGGPGSPVLGRADRFQRVRRQHRSRRNARTKDTDTSATADSSTSEETVVASASPPPQPPAQTMSFKVPYKTQDRESAARAMRQPKRSASSAPSAHQGAPFQKKPRMASGGAGSRRTLVPAPKDVAEARKQAAQKQAAVPSQSWSSGYSSDSGPRAQHARCCGSWLLRKEGEAGRLLSWLVATRGLAPGQHSRQVLLRYGMKKSVVDVTAGSAPQFQFRAWEFYGSRLCMENTDGIPVGDGAKLILTADNLAGATEVARAFLASPGVEPALVPDGWVKNHYRWLVWKFSAMEHSFPQLFAGRCLTPNMLLLQLRYRYDRELDLSQRPALRRILEKDDSASRRLVLCVAAIINTKKESAVREPEPGGKATAEAGTGADTQRSTPDLELLLTDGWYSVHAVVDWEMQRLVAAARVAVGTKLVTHSAELLNCDSGCPPLEVPANVRLRLHTNSTRRARWDVRLGFQRNPGPLPVNLSSVLPAGGLVSCVTILVARVYPMMYLERQPTGRTVLRSERAEAQEAARYEQRRQQRLEELLSEERQLMSQERSSNLADRGRRQTLSEQQAVLANLASINSGLELCKLLEAAPDPASLQAVLTEEQQQAAWRYEQDYRDRLAQELEARVRQRIADDKTHTRSVTHLVKVRCVDAQKRDYAHSALLSVWRPTEEVMSLLSEDCELQLFGVKATGTRFGCLQFSAGRQTRFRPTAAVRKPKGALHSRRTSNFAEIMAHNFHPPFWEIDTVGLIVYIGRGPQGACAFETVYLADANMMILGVCFWGGIREFGWEDLLKPGTFIAAANLQWQSNRVRTALPCAYVTELTAFSQSPRNLHLQQAIATLKHDIQTNVKQFMSACEEQILAFLGHHSGSTSALKTPPAAQPAVVSEIRQDEKTEETPSLQRLHKLQQYANPPALAPFFIPVQGSVKKKFKVPTKDSSVGVVGAPVPQDLQHESPPLSLDFDTE